MLSQQTNAADACLDSLATFLATQIPEMTIYREWPYGNQKLKYPTVSLTHQLTQVMNLPPEQIAVTAPDTDNLVTATEIVGEVDFKIQMDLWTGNKADRDVYLGKLLDAINAQCADSTGNNNPAGLNLLMTNYYNSYARYDIDKFQHVDDEAAAQRQERRAKIDLLVNARMIRQRTYYVMKTVESQVGVGQNDAQTAKVEISDL